MIIEYQILICYNYWMITKYYELITMVIWCHNFWNRPSTVATGWEARSLTRPGKDRPCGEKKGKSSPQKGYVLLEDIERYHEINSMDIKHMFKSWLVLSNMFIFHIWDVILPIDELHHFSRCPIFRQFPEQNTPSGCSMRMVQGVQGRFQRQCRMETSLKNWPAISIYFSCWCLHVGFRML